MSPLWVACDICGREYHPWTIDAHRAQCRAWRDDDEDRRAELAERAARSEWAPGEREEARA